MEFEIGIHVGPIVGELMFYKRDCCQLLSKESPT